MTFSEELAIKEALCTGNGALLARTVKRMTLPDYADLERFVSDQPGSYRHVSYRGIEVGNVRVRSAGYRPVVEAL